MKMGDAHNLAGGWLRARQPAKWFTTLAALMRAAYVGADGLRTAKTGRFGTILPDVLPGPHRDTRPVQVLLPPSMRQTPSGLIVPAA